MKWAIVCVDPRPEVLSKKLTPWHVVGIWEDDKDSPGSGLAKAGQYLRDLGWTECGGTFESNAERRELGAPTYGDGENSKYGSSWYFTTEAEVPPPPTTAEERVAFQRRYHTAHPSAEIVPFVTPAEHDGIQHVLGQTPDTSQPHAGSFKPGEC